MKYYMAYGSNLNVEQMAYRCPDAVPVGTATLNGWELRFNGVLTIERKEGAHTPVGIWKISKEDERNLDMYEGYPRLYRKEVMKVPVTDKNGNTEELNCIVYIMNEGRRGKLPPSSSYYYTVADGYWDFKFDTKILNDAVWRSRRSC